MNENDLQIIQSDDGLIVDVRSMIAQTREGVARTVNAGMTLLYWRVGKRIQTEVLNNERAEYGKEIVQSLSAQLTADFGKGFSYTALTRMVKFAENFSESAIVATLSQQLSWSHFKEIIPLKDDLQRNFYAEMCRVERWSVRTLRKKIDSMLFERTAISKKPEEVAMAELAALQRRSTHARSRLPRSLHPRFSRPQGPLPRKRPRRRHSARTRNLPARTRPELHLPSPPVPHPHRLRGFLPRPPSSFIRPKTEIRGSSAASITIPCG